jgi:hypothetical protein
MNKLQKATKITKMMIRTEIKALNEQRKKYKLHLLTKNGNNPQSDMKNQEKNSKTKISKTNKDKTKSIEIIDKTDKTETIAKSDKTAIIKAIHKKSSLPTRNSKSAI